jgi:hypothetical protein
MDKCIGRGAMKKQSSGIAAWSLLVIGFSAGILVAFPIAAPILGGVIPDAAATLWGRLLVLQWPLVERFGLPINLVANNDTMQKR